MNLRNFFNTLNSALYEKSYAKKYPYLLLHQILTLQR
jgi:hypothetical protein